MTDSKETRIQAAIAAVRSKQVPSLRQAAILFDVPRATLTQRFAGKHKDHVTANRPVQRLYPEEEASVIKALEQMDA